MKTHLAIDYLILAALLSPQFCYAAGAKISTPGDRTQIIQKVEDLSRLSTQATESIINPFQPRPDPEAANKGDKTPQPTNTDEIGNLISQSLNPSGVLRKGDEVYLQFQGGTKVKPGDAYTVTIGKTQHYIQIIRIGSDDFEFKFQEKTFSRPIKTK